MTLRSMWNLNVTAVAIASLLSACGGESGTTEGGTTEDGMTTEGSMTTPTTSGGSTAGESDSESGSESESESETTPGETAGEGEACFSNGECASQACLKFRDLEDGECVAAPDGGNTRIAGTLIDFITGDPIGGAELRVIGALAALSDPGSKPPLLTATAGATGQVDVTSTSPFGESIGIVGLVGGDGTDYYVTATGVAAPEDGGGYGPMNGNRDLWAVPSEKLTEWSKSLEEDDAVSELLPLGEKGGVIGFVRNASGEPRGGAKIVSTSKPNDSTAEIRYLNADGSTFNTSATTENGVFVIFNPGLAERFGVEGIADIDGAAGSAQKGAFVLILTVP